MILIVMTSDNDEDYRDEGRVYRDVCREGKIEE
jgi:hypothetical protein